MFYVFALFVFSTCSAIARVCVINMLCVAHTVDVALFISMFTLYR